MNKMKVKLLKKFRKWIFMNSYVQQLTKISFDILHKNENIGIVHIYFNYRNNSKDVEIKLKFIQNPSIMKYEYLRIPKISEQIKTVIISGDIFIESFKSMYNFIYKILVTDDAYIRPEITSKEFTILIPTIENRFNIILEHTIGWNETIRGMIPITKQILISNETLDLYDGNYSDREIISKAYDICQKLL